MQPAPLQGGLEGFEFLPEQAEDDASQHIPAACDGDGGVLAVQEGHAPVFHNLVDRALQHDHRPQLGCKLGDSGQKGLWRVMDDVPAEKSRRKPGKLPHMGGQHQRTMGPVAVPDQVGKSHQAVSVHHDRLFALKDPP